MALNEADTEVVRKWLKENTTNQACPFCGHEKWHYLDVVNLIASNLGEVYVRGPNAPMVPLVCKHCNYTRLLAAIGMNLACVPLGQFGPEWSKE
jgi:hypothetical protein